MLRLAAAWLCLAALPAAQAQIYAGASGPDGAVVLSNHPSAETPTLLIPGLDGLAPPAVGEAPPARDTSPRPLPKGRASAELSRLIASVAAQVDVPVDLLHAVIAVESNYDQKARSPKGAVGLMQLLPATAKRFGAKDPYAAADNLLAGAGYLKWLMGLFDGDLELVLAAYNSGEQAVIKAGRRIPPFPETQAYVPRVLAYLPSAAKLLR